MKKLYIGNIPYRATEEELNSWFTEGGFTCQSVSLVRDRYSGEPRGFGFVEIANDEEADKAVQAMNGKDFLGRNLIVNEARPPRDGGRRPGGGGGGGRGPGGGGGGRGRGRSDRGGRY